MRRRILALALMAIVLAAPADPAGAVGPPSRQPSNQTLELPPPAPTGKHPKLESHLVEVASAADRGGMLAGMRAADEQGVTASGGDVRVVATAKGSRAEVADAIRAAGGEVEAEYADLVQAYVPIHRLMELAELPTVSYIGQPSVGFPAAVPDEGVAESNAAAWHGAGVTGAGIKVGIIDQGFIGYPARQASGDLPAIVTTADFGCGGVQTFTDHGTAVAEIVHKMAPDAELYLICADSNVNLGQAKDYAIIQGITVINHSVVWFNTSRGDGSGGPGSPDAIVADARANGILWVNAAGNNGQSPLEPELYDAFPNFWHEFTPNDEVNDITMAAGHSMCGFLRWDSWPATAQDYDIYLFRLADTSTPVAGSAGVQDGSQAPIEGFCYTNNTGISQTFGIAIAEFDATAAPRFDLFVLLQAGQPEYIVTAGSISEPGSSPQAMAVGAICWLTDVLEPYSSQGPTIDGRTKPDIAGQTRTTSSVYGAASGCGAGFAGTSASAPHVAGAAALVAEANPGFTPAQVQSSLESLALDRGATGKDSLYGSGRLWLGSAPLVDPDGATFFPLTPARLLDSRFGTGLNGVFQRNVPRTFQVTGLGGVPADATAVTGNLTATGMTGAGFVYLGPDPLANPPSSTLNFPAGDNRGNGLTVDLSATGSLSATFGGPVAGTTTHLVFDVTGYFLNDDTGATFFPLTPARLLDSRFGTGLNGVFQRNVPRTFQVTGLGGVPADATAVTGNLTATGMTGAGFVYLGPDPLANPPSSTLNFPAGDNRGNGLTVDLSATGSLSATFGGPVAGTTTHLVFDVTGYFLNDDTGATFFPLTPARLLDSRFGTGLNGVFQRNVPRTFQVTGLGGVPADATAVTGNLTATGMTGAGFVYLGPDPLANPPSSTLNFPAGDNRGNGLTVDLSATGSLSATFGGPVAGTTTHLVFDVTGYFH